MSEESLVIRVLGNDASYSATMKRVQASIRAASGAQTQFGHSGVTSVQAVSASLRLAEGNYNNLIRAAERFAASNKAIAVAAQAIFPVVGAIAIGAIFARGTEEVVKLVQHIEQIPTAVQRGYQSIVTSQNLANDSLEITNDKLRNQLAVFAHKPENTLALALDEDREYADRLAESLQKGVDNTRKLLEEQKNGVWAQLLGKGSTADTYGNILNFQQALSDNAQNLADAKRDGNQPEIDYYTSERGQLQTNEDAWLKKDIAARSKPIAGTYNPLNWADFANPLVGTQDANLAADRKEQQKLHAAMQGDKDHDVNVTLDKIKDAEDRVATLTDQLATAKREGNTRTASLTQTSLTKAQADFAQLGKGLTGQTASEYNDASAELKAQYSDSQARTGQALSQKDAEAQMRRYQTQFEQMEQGYESMGFTTPVSEIAEFWQSAEDSFKPGSEQYIEANRHFLDAIKEIQQQVHDQITKGMASWKEAGKADIEQFDSMERLSDSLRTNEYKSFAEGSGFSVAPDVAKIQEAQLQIQQLTGHISEQGAALAAAGIKAKEYSDEIAHIDFQLQDKSLSQKEIDDLNKQRQGIQADQEINSDQMAYLRHHDTLSGGVSDTLSQMLAQWSDMTQQIASTGVQTINGINDALVKSIFNPEKGFGIGKTLENGLGETFRSTGESLTKTALQKSESYLFGGGKAGTAANPLWVRIAGALGHAFGFGGGSASGGGGGLLGHLLGGGTVGKANQPDSTGVGGFFRHLFGGGAAASPINDGGMGGNSDSDSLADSLFGAGSGFQGAFAGGGSFMAGHSMLVGENGPELLTPGNSGTVIPNHEMGSYFGGGGMTIHNHFEGSDFTGSDPAQIESTFNRMFARQQGAIGNIAVNAVHDYAMRTPSTQHRTS